MNLEMKIVKLNFDLKEFYHSFFPDMLKVHNAPTLQTNYVDVWKPNRNTFLEDNNYEYYIKRKDFIMNQSVM